MQDLSLSKLAKDLVDKYLGGDWTVLSRQLQLQSPTSSLTKSAWDYLENTFQQGDAVELGKALVPLLNAPYGYDYNTLSLLFACWYGLNRRDLVINVANRQVSLANLSTTGRSKPDDFIEKLGTGRLWRRNRGARDKELKEAIERIEKGNLSKEQAGRDQGKLRKFLDEDDGTNTRLSEDVQNAFDKVVSGLERLETYDTLATSIDKGSEKARSVSDYATQLKQVDRLPQLVTVRSESPPLEAVRKIVMTRLQTFAQTECEKNEKLSLLTNYGMKVNALENLKKELERLNLSSLVTRVAQALERLEAAKNELDTRGRLQNELNMIQQLQFKNVDLAQLLDNKKKLIEYQNFGVESIVKEAQLKLTKVQESIDQLGTFSGLLWKRIDAVKTSSEARALGEEILRKRSLYENTKDLSYLDDDRERTRRIEAYFAQLEKPIQLKSPTEVVELTTQLESLQQTLSENDTLSVAQIEHAQIRLEKIQAFAAGQRVEAERWLEGITADLDAGNNLKVLRNKLGSPPAFLAESLQPQLAELSERVETALMGEAQTAGQLEAIKQLSDRGTLVQLRENLTRLDDYETAQQSVQAAASTKRDVLTKKITRLTEQLSAWQEKQAKMTRPRDVDQLIGEVQRAEGTYTGSELEAEVGSLLAQLETIAEVMRELYAPPTVTTAREAEARQQFLADQHVLTELLPTSIGDTLRRTIEKERRALAERIAREEQQLAETADKLITAQNSRAVENLDPRLKALLTFFNGSEQSAELNSLVERFVTLGQYFKDLGRIEAAPTATPADLSAQRRGVDEAYNRHKEILGDAQQDAARMQLDRIEDVLKSKQEAARAWLTQHQETLSRAATAADLNRLEHKLQDVPAFLPDELRHEHTEAQKQVTAKLGGLELEAIEDRFKRLGSAEREACLERLQMLMREFEAV